AIAGISVDAVRIGVEVFGRNDMTGDIEFQTYPASPRPIAGLQLTATLSNRVLDVIVRSTVAMPIDGAQVILLSGLGRTRIKSESLKIVGDLAQFRGAGVQTHFAKPIVGENVPKAASDKIRTGDLVAHVEHARPGELLVCALALSGDLVDPNA